MVPLDKVYLLYLLCENSNSDQIQTVLLELSKSVDRRHVSDVWRTDRPLRLSYLKMCTF